MLARATAILLLCCIFSAHAKLDGFTDQEADAGLKAALEKGAIRAVALLGKTDGFFGNGAVRIPLPDSLGTYEPPMRAAGMGKYADGLVLAMNRAAEAAAPEARKVFVDAVKKMDVQDAKVILASSRTACTDYFKRSTTDQLRKKFLPIVKQAAAKARLAEAYNQYAQQGAQFGLAKKEPASLDDYVTQKALDGLFVVMAEEERKLRREPATSGSDLLIKVFGALKT
jgi:hypothetical protein